jgi:hypothetical protein
MRTLAAAGALLIVLGLPLAFADDSSKTGGSGQSSQTTGSGSGQGGEGTTGWSAPHNGPTTPGHPNGPPPPDSPQKDAPVATGADLNGPATAFPANKSPE